MQQDLERVKQSQEFTKQFFVAANLKKFPCVKFKFIMTTNRGAFLRLELNPCGESDQLIVHLNFGSNG